jgi:c-di-GMP-binding flagellar brake protein YcgR
MRVAAGNILNEGQVVQLDLGAKTQVLPCRVLGFGGKSVILAPVVKPPAPTVEVLRPGATAYVIVEDDGQIHALRALVAGAPEAAEVVVTVTDEFRLGQRRRYSRAPISVPARVGEWETVTRDVSAGGVRLARGETELKPGQAVELVIEAAQAGLRIEAAAEVVRVTAIDVSLRFTRIEPGDATLLQQLAVAYYRLT